MTSLEKKLAGMTPAQRKKTAAAISDMMGMPAKKKKTASTKKTSITKKK